MRQRQIFPFTWKLQRITAGLSKKLEFITVDEFVVGRGKHAADGTLYQMALAS
jgi:hypothetical protein